MVHIEIDGKKLSVRQGQTIIEVADEVGIAIPRFCYHKKLSIAANCRMCLVEVANAAKPLPACATPVSEGMKVYTKSEVTQVAQKAVMEFLLINHPLDCPVCDQGGQCELQDVALGYGAPVSRYREGKRVVKDKPIGPLISTEMTRCIHCTRCVRFGSEVNGIRELGATGRGESMEIGTYLEKSVDATLSGNVIDLCPVGALTAKPSRFQARAWELKAYPSLSPHDCVGSNLFYHVHHDKVMRAEPRENEALNEVWLTDRDRFSYEGFNEQRLTQPLIKVNGQWQPIDWSVALDKAAKKLASTSLGVLASPNSTLEEFYLLQKLARLWGCHNIDHRLRQLDFSHQHHLATYPQLGISLEALSQQSTILLIGSEGQKEQPLISHRIRQATLRGAKAFAINPRQVAFNFTLTDALCGRDFVALLLEVVKHLAAKTTQPLADHIKAKLSDINPSPLAVAFADKLSSTKSSVILGAYCLSHPQASLIYAASRLLATLLAATWGETSEGANSAGGWIAGALPHRLPLGEAAPEQGLNALEMWQKPQSAYLLLNVEPEYDCATPHQALKALQKAYVVSLSAFDSPALREYADLILPVSPLTENAGTYVNALGQWQTFLPVVAPLLQSRPAWKVLRQLGQPDFDYACLEDVRASLKPTFSPDTLLDLPWQSLNQAPGALIRLAPVPLYAVDGVVRRALSLQKTQVAKALLYARLNSQTAAQKKLTSGDKVWVEQQGVRSLSTLPILIDETLPAGVVLVASAIEPACALDAPFGVVTLIKEDAS